MVSKNSSLLRLTGPLQNNQLNYSVKGNAPPSIVSTKILIACSKSSLLQLLNSNLSLVHLALRSVVQPWLSYSYIVLQSQ